MILNLECVCFGDRNMCYKGKFIVLECQGLCQLYLIQIEIMLYSYFDSSSSPVAMFVDNEQYVTVSVF